MTSTDDDVLLRPASPADAAALAEVHLEARRAAVPAMPPSVHTDEETREWVSGWLAGQDEVWVAEVRGAPVGYARLTAQWLDDLYVAPGHAGRGIGSALLELAKSLRPGGFALWVFESNVPARRFYESHGLVELERTDGSGNEERQPDVRMAWPGAEPMAYLRDQVDAVDDELALLLARRAALTVAIQEFKEVPGHAGRDPEREAAIATRMARHAPGLGAAALRRIMHEVITAGLDAHARAVTLSAYETQADRRADGAPEPPPEMVRLLDDFVEALPADARVLEVGSASGRDGAAQGYGATRLDPLRDDLGGPYDGICAGGVLLHLSRREMATVLGRFRSATRDGGALVLWLQEGDGPGGPGGSGHGQVQDGRDVTYWRADALRDELSAAGWTVARLDSFPPRRPTEQRWLHVLATAG